VTEVEQHFVSTLEDLENCIKDNNPYATLRISALLRKLFLDDYPLTDRINREYGRKITFKVIKHFGLPPGFPKPAIYTLQDGLDPSAARPGKPIENLNKDQFLKKVVALVRDHKYTVREVILFEANIKGGIHADVPKEAKEKALDAIDSKILLDGHHPLLRQLKPIGRVVLEALRELREDVTKKTSSPQ
jgi:hypothetical protein